MDIGKIIKDTTPRPSGSDAAPDEADGSAHDAMALIAAAAAGELHAPAAAQPLDAPPEADELDDGDGGDWEEDDPGQWPDEPEQDEPGRPSAPSVPRKPKLSDRAKATLGQLSPRAKAGVGLSGALAIGAVVKLGFVLAGGGSSAAPPAAAPQVSASVMPLGDGPAPSAQQTSAEPDADGVVKPESAIVDPKACTIGSTAPMSAFVDSLEHHDSAWVCVAPYGDGTLLIITLPSPTVVTKIRVIPGFDGAANGHDAWLKYRAVDEIRWYFDGSQPIAQKCGGERKACEISVVDQAAPQGRLPKQPPVARQIKMMIAHTVEASGPPATPTTTAASNPLGGPLGGDLSLPGLTVPTLPTKSTAPGDSGPPAFAVGTIQILGHPAE